MKNNLLMLDINDLQLFILIGLTTLPLGNFAPHTSGYLLLCGRPASVKTTQVLKTCEI